MFLRDNESVAAAIERMAQVLFDANSDMRSVVIDVERLITDKSDTAHRYAAVIRKPTGVILLGSFSLSIRAEAECSRFWWGMRQLIAPVED